jgi:transcriptional regulator with XRE-family HTH domain
MANNLKHKPYSRKPGSTKFGVRLKDERIRRGFQVLEFAALVGCHQSQITGAENRGITPNFWTIVAMAQVLECSIDWLAGIED